MASTFYELFSDFQDKIKQYTETLDVTEYQFVRLITRGVQKFQRDTEYIEAMATIPRNPSAPFYNMPLDVLRVIMIVDSNGIETVINGTDQGQRMREMQNTRYARTPRVHDYQLRTNAQLATMYNNVLTITPDTGEPFYTMYFIPDISAISSSSTQWATWFPHTVNFIPMFMSTGIPRALVPYEEACLNWAVAEYIKSKGSANYVVFENNYKSEVKQAILNKPLYNKQQARDYFMSPYS